jgi:hypothetical protein
MPVSLAEGLQGTANIVGSASRDRIELKVGGSSNDVE